MFSTVLAYEVDFFLHIVAVAVERYNYTLTELSQVLQVLVHVGNTHLQGFKIRLAYDVLRHATMHLECTGSNHEYGKLWSQACLATLDVVELFCTEVGTETCFGNGIVAKGHGKLSCEDRVTSVSDVCKRTSVYKGRSIFGSLNQVRRDSVLQEYGDGTCYAQILHGERLAFESKAEEDILDTATEVVFVLSQAKDGHDFRSRSDVEARFLGDAVGLRAQACYDVTERTVVHVQYTTPEDFLQTEAIVTVLVCIVVEQSRDHVVGRSNGVEVAGKVEVDFLHRKHLCVSATSRTTLHTEAWTERRFTKGYDGLLANLVHTQRQTYRYGSLTDTRLGRCNSGNQNQITLLYLFFVNQRDVHFSHVTSVVCHLVFWHIEFSCQFLNFHQLDTTSDFNIRFHFFKF